MQLQSFVATYNRILNSASVLIRSQAPRPCFFTTLLSVLLPQLYPTLDTLCKAVPKLHLSTARCYKVHGRQATGWSPFRNTLLMQHDVLLAFQKLQFHQHIT